MPCRRLSPTSPTARTSVRCSTSARPRPPEPAPLVVYIHGGGWVNGDKVGVGDLKELLDNGISVASINYRFTTQAQAAGIKPPVKWPLEDAARAIQFLRSKAGEWNIDKTRIAATGGSAGACSSLWLAFHDDMARPDSTDPIARESTRLTSAAVNGAQTSLDPKQLREWMPNMRMAATPSASPASGGRDSQFQQFYDHRDEVLDWIKEYSPYAHVGPGDPPVFLDYPPRTSLPSRAKPRPTRRTPPSSACCSKRSSRPKATRSTCLPRPQRPRIRRHHRFPDRQAQGFEALK